MNENHTSKLEKLCRVCGGQLGKGKSARRYTCSNYHADLKETFSIDTHLDEPHKHPTQFCHPCKNAIYFNKKDNRTLYDWKDHRESTCLICSPPPLKLGRPKRQPKTGRPPIVSYQSAIKHIKSLATSISDKDLVTDTHVPLEFQCPICLNLLHQPIELTVCQTYVCASCCCEWLRQSKSLSCPCCYRDHLDDYCNTIKSPPDIILTALKVICTGATSSSCDDVLRKSQASPLSHLDEKLLSSLLRRSLSSSVSPTLQVKTGGQVSTTILYTLAEFT